MPSLLGYVERFGKLPKDLTFSIAALLAFYKGSEIKDGALIGNRNGEDYKIMDDPEVLEFFKENSGLPSKELTEKYLSNIGFHGQDLTKWEPVAKACESMSHNKEGALIVIGETDELHDVIASGEAVNANINQLLIENIFFKNSPLHDGAMIIVGDRIESAACILPVSQSEELPKSFGLRHRSAMGITEKTNAVAVVVSEETGIISVFHKGSFQRDMKADTLMHFLSENVR